MFFWSVCPTLPRMKCFCPASAKDAGIKVGRQYLPITLIQDGQLIRENLKKAGHDQQWLERELKKRESDLSSTLLMTIDEGGTVVWIGKEEP